MSLPNMQRRQYDWHPVNSTNYEMEQITFLYK